ncbi:MAG TPA: hypothetical protein VGJ84_00490 [Polyangiaceae bacterium]
MPGEFLVIGGGAAGAAAAWRFAVRGAKVVLVAEGVGCSGLYSGALDYAPWELAPVLEQLDRETIAFANALGCWVVSNRRARIATSAGLVRPARGIDNGLLDLEPLAGKCIAVADVDRNDWDAAPLARTLSASSWSRSTKTEFYPVRANAVRESHESRIPAYDFARLHDAPERSDWLARQLSTVSLGADAWLLGPWLGVEENAAARLRSSLKMAIGETTSPPGASAGARFELARDGLLAKVGVSFIRARVESLEVVGSGVRTRITEPEGGTSHRASDAVVLAIGGVAAGGITLDSPEHLPDADEFRLSVAAPIELELDGKPLGAPSSLFGPEFRDGVALLERVGIACQGAEARGHTRLFVAGDARAERPRTMLEAVASGIAAADAALRLRGGG